MFDDLVEQFGEHSVFMDVAAIEVGRDFRKAIDERIATCGVLLAVIGAVGWMKRTVIPHRLRVGHYQFGLLHNYAARTVF